MRVLFSSTRGAGHVQPLLPYAHALLARGHEVLVAAPASVNASLATAGLAHAPFDHPGDKLLAPLWQQLNALPAEETAAFAIREIFAGAAARAALPGLLETLRAWRPDLVVRESAEFAALVAAEVVGVPHARVAVHLPSFEEIVVSPATAAFDTLRAQVGLSPDEGASLRAEPVFAAFPASLEDPTVALQGRPPMRAQMPAADSPGSGARWASSGEGAPLVYITFGTIAGGLPQTQAVYRAAIEAIATLRVRALLTTGPAMNADALGAVPAHVQVEAWVPQREVLPHASLVVCHGGSGTLLGALAAGVPLVVAPLGADQPYNAKQVARAGAGLAVPGADAAALRVAVVRALDDAALRAGARRLAEEMASLPGLDAAVASMLAMV